MATLKQVLYQDPWVPYNDSFIQSQIILTYPKNQIFATQLLTKVSSLPVYQQYPMAEQFDVSLFDTVEWERDFIVLDRELHVVMAPLPVLQLIQLDRRLQYQTASQVIFGPFRFWPLELFHSQWFWIIGLIVSWILYLFWSCVKRQQLGHLVLPSKM